MTGRDTDVEGTEYRYPIWGYYRELRNKGYGPLVSLIGMLSIESVLRNLEKQEAVRRD